ncbi:glycoside hydrolase family 5 protein [candidate division KSB1 bacterium]|nr:glycoside hydrolase family 5 protein [candidate division KSB1 bacterium]
MTRFLTILMRTACFFLAIIFVSCTKNATDSPVQKHGQLQVIGANLCDDRGHPVQLRGMSTHGLQWYGWPQYITPEALDTLSYAWKADILRLAMYPDEGGYKTNPPFFRAMLDTLVDETLKRGMYCLIDWHMLHPGDPWDNIEEAKAFFNYVAKKHGGKKYVLYEICNEPNGETATWPRIKSYAEEVIPIIRLYDPDGIIIVGTPAWSSLGISGPPTGEKILADPLTDEFAHNLMYSFHFYAASHTDDYREKFPLFAERLPIFVTEWGCQEYTGDGANDVPNSTAWLDLLNTYKVSWCNWNFSPDHRSGAVWKEGTFPAGPFDDSNLKESGILVKNWLRQGR